MHESLKDASRKAPLSEKEHSLMQAWRSNVNFRKVAVLVEGKDDRAVYNKFLDNQEAEIVVIGTSGEHLEMFRNIKRTGIECIGIRDADFYRLLNLLHIEEGYFYTDGADLEMMVLCNEDSIKELGSTFDTIITAENIENIFRNLEVISIIRCYNAKEKIMYNFKGLSLAAKSDEVLRNFDAIHSEIVKSSTAKSFNQSLALTPSSYRIFASSLPAAPFNHRMRGHDLVALLVRHIKREGHYSNISEEKVEIAIKSMFGADRFVATQLYQDIKDWESRNRRVLRV